MRRGIGGWPCDGTVFQTVARTLALFGESTELRLRALRGGQVAPGGATVVITKDVRRRGRAGVKARSALDGATACVEQAGRGSAIEAGHCTSAFGFAVVSSSTTVDLGAVGRTCLSDGVELRQRPFVAIGRLQIGGNCRPLGPFLSLRPWDLAPAMRVFRDGLAMRGSLARRPSIKADEMSVSQAPWAKEAVIGRPKVVYRRGRIRRHEV